MTSIQIFQNPEFGEIRTTIHKGEIAFVAKDIAERLGYIWRGMSGTMPHVPEEWKGYVPFRPPLECRKWQSLRSRGSIFSLPVRISRWRCLSKNGLQETLNLKISREFLVRNRHPVFLAES